VDVVDIVNFSPLRLLGFTYNGAAVYVCGCTGTMVGIYSLLHLRACTSFSPVTTLCWFRC